MSEEEKEEKHQEIKRPTRFSKFLATTSFVLALISFTIILFCWIEVLIDDFLFGVPDIFRDILFFLLPPTLLLALLAPILGCCTYLRIDTYMDPLLKRRAKWCLILSLFFWIMLFFRLFVYFSFSGDVWMD